MKLEELSKISNPKEVYRKFKENGYDEYTNIYVSTRKVLQYYNFRRIYDGNSEKAMFKKMCKLIPEETIK